MSYVISSLCLSFLLYDWFRQAATKFSRKTQFIAFTYTKSFLLIMMTFFTSAISYRRHIFTPMCCNLLQYLSNGIKTAAYLFSFNRSIHKNVRIVRLSRVGLLHTAMQLLQLTHRLTRVANQLKEAQHAYQAATTPSEMLDKLNEEIDTKRHLVSEVLTKELQSIERYVQDLKEIESQPSVGPEYLDKINQRMQSINREINAIVEKKMLREDTMDDKLTLFKQNVRVRAAR